MANFIFNKSKGKDIALAENVINNTPANSAFTIVLLKVGQADDDLNNYTNLSLLLADAGNTEADFTNYARKEVTDTTLTSVINNTTNLVNVNFPDQVWTAAGGAANNALVRLLVCYDPDTTGGDDTALIPVYAYDFVATTNGEDLEARPHADGLSTQ